MRVNNYHCNFAVTEILRSHLTHTRVIWMIQEKNENGLHDEIRCKATYQIYPTCRQPLWNWYTYHHYTLGAAFLVKQWTDALKAPIHLVRLNPISSQKLLPRSSFWGWFLTYAISFKLMLFPKYTFYIFMIVHMQAWYLLDFDNKAEINRYCFLLETLGLYLIASVHNMFRSGRRGDSAGLEVNSPTNGCRG